MRDVDTTRAYSTHNGQLSLMDGFNHGYSLPQYPFGMQGLRLGTTAGRRLLAAMFVQVPCSPPRHRVLSFPDTCSPGLAFIVPLDYLWLRSLSPSALTLLSPHLDIHTLHFMTLRFSNERTFFYDYSRSSSYLHRCVYGHNM